MGKIARRKKNKKEEERRRKGLNRDKKKSNSIKEGKRQYRILTLNLPTLLVYLFLPFPVKMTSA